MPPIGGVFGPRVSRHSCACWVTRPPPTADDAHSEEGWGWLASNASTQRVDVEVVDFGCRGGSQASDIPLFKPGPADRPFEVARQASQVAFDVVNQVAESRLYNERGERPAGAGNHEAGGRVSTARAGNAQTPRQLGLVPRKSPSTAVRVAERDAGSQREVTAGTRGVVTPQGPRSRDALSRKAV